MIICCAIANIMCCANTNNYVIMYMRVLLCHRICSVLLATCFLRWFRNFYFNLTKLSFDSETSASSSVPVSNTTLMASYNMKGT